jgi:hypothetical protein
MNDNAEDRAKGQADGGDANGDSIGERVRLRRGPGKVIQSSPWVIEVPY